MTAPQNLYVALCLMAITDVPLIRGMWNFCILLIMHLLKFLYEMSFYTLQITYDEGKIYGDYRLETVVFLSVDIILRSGSLKSNIDGSLNMSSIIM